MENEVCIPNINLAERRRRLVFGVLALAFGLALLAWMVLNAVPRWYRLSLFLVFTGAATGYYQWRDET